MVGGGEARVRYSHPSFPFACRERVQLEPLGPLRPLGPLPPTIAPPHHHPRTHNSVQPRLWWHAQRGERRAVAAREVRGRQRRKGRAQRAARGGVRGCRGVARRERRPQHREAQDAKVARVNGAPSADEVLPPPRRRVICVRRHVRRVRKGRQQDDRARRRQRRVAVALDAHRHVRQDTAVHGVERLAQLDHLERQQARGRRGERVARHAANRGVQRRRKGPRGVRAEARRGGCPEHRAQHTAATWRRHVAQREAPRST